MSFEIFNVPFEVYTDDHKEWFLRLSHARCAVMNCSISHLGVPEHIWLRREHYHPVFCLYNISLPVVGIIVPLPVMGVSLFCHPEKLVRRPLWCFQEYTCTWQIFKRTKHLRRKPALKGLVNKPNC